jgi:hypothetical protein
MDLETFRKGVSDFTSLVEKSDQADLKLVQDHNNVASWLVGVSTGAFIFTFSTGNNAFKESISALAHLVVIFQGIQIFSALMLRIFIKSYSVYSEQKLIFLGLQKLYLEKNPKNDELEDYDLFALYSKLTDFIFMRTILAGIVDKLLTQRTGTGMLITFYDNRGR